MFENEPDKVVKQERSRAMLWVGAAAALLLAVLILLLARSKPEDQTVTENLLRAGATEFDAYKGKVEIEVTDKITHPNMIGMNQYEVRAKLHNRGERALTAVELFGKMIDLDDKLIKQSASLPIPRARTEPLKPGETMTVRVKIDAPKNVTEDMIKDLAVEVGGLRFQ